MQLTHSPSGLSLMVKAATKGSRYQPSQALLLKDFPATSIELIHQPIDADLVNAFNAVCGWPNVAKTHVHPCFLHTLAFPLHMKLMLHQQFPFKLLGLVHLHNEITHYRPVQFGEHVDLSCRFIDVQKHNKGWLFTIQTEIGVKGECIWQSKSSNLFRCTHNDRDIQDKPGSIQLMSLQEQVSRWGLSSGVGRDYARVSGDYNLIHLYSLTARLFGFRRHLAHGMYNKARCMSVLTSDFSAPYRFTVEFKRPVFLPSEVSLHVRQQQQTSLFQLQSSDASELHLIGQLYNL